MAWYSLILGSSPAVTFQPAADTDPDVTIGGSGEIILTAPADNSTAAAMFTKNWPDENAEIEADKLYPLNITRIKVIYSKVHSASHFSTGVIFMAYGSFPTASPDIYLTPDQSESFAEVIWISPAFGTPTPLIQFTIQTGFGETLTIHDVQVEGTFVDPANDPENTPDPVEGVMPGGMPGSATLSLSGTYIEPPRERPADPDEWWTVVRPEIFPNLPEVDEDEDELCATRDDASLTLDAGYLGQGWCEPQLYIADALRDPDISSQYYPPIITHVRVRFSGDIQDANPKLAIQARWDNTTHTLWELGRDEWPYEFPIDYDPPESIAVQDMREIIFPVYEDSIDPNDPGSLLYLTYNANNNENFTIHDVQVSGDFTASPTPPAHYHRLMATINRNNPELLIPVPSPVDELLWDTVLNEDIFPLEDLDELGELDFVPPHAIYVRAGRSISLDAKIQNACEAEEWYAVNTTHVLLTISGLLRDSVPRVVLFYYNPETRVEEELASFDAVNPEGVPKAVWPPQQFLLEVPPGQINPANPGYLTRLQLFASGGDEFVIHDLQVAGPHSTSIPFCAEYFPITEEATARTVYQDRGRQALMLLGQPSGAPYVPRPSGMPIRLESDMEGEVTSWKIEWTSENEIDGIPPISVEVPADQSKVTVLPHKLNVWTGPDMAFVFMDYIPAES